MSSRLAMFKRLLAAVLLIGAAAAWSADLSELKAEGLVGERADGYLGIVPAQVSAEVKAVVADVNRKRRTRYEQIAAENGIEFDLQA